MAATQQINSAKLKQLDCDNEETSDSKVPNPLQENEEDVENEATTTIENRKPGPSGTTKETLLGKNEEMTARTELLRVDETAPPADPLTT